MTMVSDWLKIGQQDDQSTFRLTRGLCTHVYLHHVFLSWTSIGVFYLRTLCLCYSTALRHALYSV